jgi:hypothetical protein
MNIAVKGELEYLWAYEKPKEKPSPPLVNQEARWWA